jgi:sugar-specific transcriptional regulator TrmB
MEKNILQQLGLTENEALIYETLLQNGKQKASQIQKKTPLKRGLVYKNLENLEKKGLVVREDNNQKVSTFTPIHPNVLKGLAEQQVKQAREAQNLLQNELGSLVSMYNLANNKPGVEFCEGLEGVKKVIC